MKLGATGTTPRRLLALAVTCLAVTGVIGCGDDGESQTTASGDAPEITGTVTVWDNSYKVVPAHTKAADKLDAEFERLHPGVTVKHVAQPVENYDQLLQAAFAARETPDVVKLQPGNRGVLRWTKALDKLNDRITDDMRTNIDDWTSVSAGFETDGDVYAVPVGLQGYVFYYNKDLFEQAGLPRDFKPETWADVEAAGKKLKAAGVQPFTGGNKEGYENLFWMTAAWPTVATCEQAIDLGRGDLPFTEDIVASALAPQKTMQDAGLFEEDNFSTQLFPDGAARFGEGQGAMFLGIYSGAMNYAEFNPKLGEENVGIFFAPGSRYLGRHSETSWGIPAAAKNKDAAWAYIEFLTGRQGEETNYAVGATLPGRRDVEVAADAPAQEKEILEAVRAQESCPDLNALLPGAVQFGPIGLEVNEWLQHRKSLEDVQRLMQEAAEDDA